MYLEYSRIISKTAAAVGFEINVISFSTQMWELRVVLKHIRQAVQLFKIVCFAEGFLFDTYWA
jgi:hypothetical protein